MAKGMSEHGRYWIVGAARTDHETITFYIIFTYVNLYVCYLVILLLIRVERSISGRYDVFRLNLTVHRAGTYRQRDIKRNRPFFHLKKRIHRISSRILVTMTRRGRDRYFTHFPVKLVNSML